MIGSSADRKLKTRAAETWGVLLFLVETFSAHRESGRLGPDADRMLEAAKCLVDLVTIMKSSDWAMAAVEVGSLLESWKRFCALTNDQESLRTPKRHIMWHFVVMAGYLGNPRYYANWRDESLNKVLKAACRDVSQATFEQTVLLSMPFLLETNA